MDLFDKVTVLIYTFPRKGDEKGAFGKIAVAIERTWKFSGRLKTIIVASHPFPAVDNFAAAHANVEIQIEPSLVYGDIKTMSLDCITRLWKRFSTPYVLIIQDDGYPVREGLEEFVGKWDFIGAPSVRDERRRLMNLLGFPCLNGGFSLRSHRICVRAANAWNRWWRFFLDPSSRFFSEDTFYTLTACLGWGYRHGLKFAGEKDAFRFSYDPLKGLVTRPQGVDSFGVHGRVPEVTVLAYHFWKKEGYEEAFAKVRHAFEETWRHCGRLKSVLVVNETVPCVERFAAENANVEVQVEESLVPGRIFTMSADMNGRLWKRFSTPYVLIIQSDGYPLRSGLEAFVGKYDFIGAPYVGLQWWKTLAAGLANYHVQNGGFSLRSRRICEAAAEYWNGKYHALGDTRDASEDIFYTGTLVRKERKYRKSFRFATSRESLKFSWDASVPIPRPKELPFGFHGKETAKVVEGGAAWQS